MSPVRSAKTGKQTRHNKAETNSRRENTDRIKRSFVKSVEERKREPAWCADSLRRVWPSRYRKSKADLFPRSALSRATTRLETSGSNRKAIPERTARHT